MSDIAELAGVQRPVVSNWRRRHPSFPAPVADDPGKPLFEAHGVIDWLAATGRAERSVLEGALALHLLVDISARVPTRRLVEGITALICLRYLDQEPLSMVGAHPTAEYFDVLRERAALVDLADQFLRAEIEGLGIDDVWLAGAADGLVEAAWDCRAAFERVMAMRDRLGVTNLSAGAVSSALAELAAGVCGVQERAEHGLPSRVVDPGAGAGDMLLGVLGAVGEDATLAVAGVEADPFLARLARRRLVVQGVAAADVMIRSGGPLDQEFDTLVTCLPFTPAERRSAAAELSLVEQVADGLAPGATAVVIGSATSLVEALPPGAAGQARAKLLECGVVEAIIALPGGLTPFRPAYEPAMWVMRRERSPRWQGRVLLADVADRQLTAELIQDLVTDVVTWRRAGYHPVLHARAVAEQVPVSVLVKPDARLLPLPSAGSPALANPDPAESVIRVRELEDELGSVAETDELLRTWVALGGGTPAARVRIGDVVTIRSGTRLAAAEVVPAGNRVVLGSDEVIGAVRVGSRRVDLASWATRHATAELTLPGDVVVTLSPHFGVYVDVAGLSVVEYPARVLRVRSIPADERPRLTPRVLAALLSSQGVRGRAPGAVRSATRLGDLKIPLLSADATERLDHLLKQADRRRRRAEREIDLVEELCRLISVGMVDGTLMLDKRGD